MASISYILKTHLTKINKPSNPTTLFPQSNFPSSPFLPFNSKSHQHQHFHVSSYPTFLPQETKIPSLLLHCSLSYSTPPISKEEAILQAKTCLSSALEKPLNNLKLAGRVKNVKQPKFRVEIPIIDDSPESISQLALDIFGDLLLKRKGAAVKFLILWPNVTLADKAIKAFESHDSSNQVDHIDISSVINGDTKVLNSCDVAVFVSPESSQLDVLKAVSDNLYPKPVVFFNPKWVLEDESGFGDLSGFVSSFEVIFSFMGLEVQGILSKGKGVIFKCVRDGVLSGERWNVFVEEDGGFKVISKFKSRPSIVEVENVLYNLMAINSPITKSVKFLRDLVSNVTGKK